MVFQPNYRGSDNLGNAYQAAIVGDAGAGPGRDVMSGVAMLKHEPYVDLTATAVTGWSYGGFMTTWLIGNYPNEWKAGDRGRAGHGLGGQVQLRRWQRHEPLQLRRIAVDRGRKAYRRQSPITYARRVRAPTLVMTNLEDFRVPPTQAFELYRAMKDNGVETQFIGFDGRTHASGDPVNGREELRVWVDWVASHFGAVP